jgi:hypothetical protein
VIAVHNLLRSQFLWSVYTPTSTLLLSPENIAESQLNTPAFRFISNRCLYWCLTRCCALSRACD